MSGDSTRWTVHGSRRIYASPWVNLDLDEVEIPGGRRFDHHVIRFEGPSVGAVIVEDDRVLLTRRHRFTIGRPGWEIPAGWCDEGETPEEAVRREVLEETGYAISSAEHLVTQYSLAGISTHQFQFFVCGGVVQQGEADKSETSQLGWFTWPEVRALLTDGEIPDGCSAAALTFFLSTRR
ncbi:NUDIX hydrolase [Amycolatopsis sp. NPDC059657]|uniref:NUDIX hydrolase n=1 Tax=Amycolatopsis sp. NPDC059657 TaxID=3346899 RepID=UPI00366F271B